MQEHDPIISFLAQEKFLDADTLQSVIDKHQQTGQGLLSILKNDELLDENQLTRVVSVAHNIEFINLSPDMVDPMVAHLLSYEMVNQHNLIPVRKEDGTLFVAMSSPLNLAVRDQVETKTGFKVVPLAATPEAIKQAITYHFNVRNVTQQDIVSMRLKQAPAEVKAGPPKPTSRKIADAPITRLVSSIINGAIDARASDIHIEPQQPDMKVRYRVDGILRDAIEVPVMVHQELVSHIKILADMDISERRVPQDGHIGTQFHGKEYDLRVSSLPAVGGEKIVIRILDKSSGARQLQEVVASPDDLERIKTLIENPYGVILLTGPTGSGKTTTLYAILQTLNTPERNIITVEDPVEYRLGGITQVQVKPIVGMTFATGLRSILRQDPDVILVGEIRDMETAEIAISAALTGHLVLSTLHTNDAAGAVSRLINLGVAPFLVSSALLGVVAQRLIRTLCPQCSQPYEPTEQELGCLRPAEGAQGVKLYRGAGCNGCYYTGYFGRRAIYEMLTATPEIKSMIAAGTNDDQVKAQAIKKGMKTLRNAATEQVLTGVTTLAEILRVVDMRQE
jgi:type IV pilus assembly protein PilB